MNVSIGLRLLLWATTNRTRDTSDIDMIVPQVCLRRLTK